MNGLICSSGGAPYKVEVTTAPTLVVGNSNATRYIRITNLGSNAVYMCPGNETPVAETGIVLTPYLSPGCYIEFNNTNMFFCNLMAVTSTGSSDVAVLIGF